MSAGQSDELRPNLKVVLEQVFAEDWLVLHEFAHSGLPVEE